MSVYNITGLLESIVQILLQQFLIKSPDLVFDLNIISLKKSKIIFLSLIKPRKRSWFKLLDLYFFSIDRDNLLRTSINTHVTELINFGGMELKGFTFLELFYIQKNTDL